MYRSTQIFIQMVVMPTCLMLVFLPFCIRVDAFTAIAPKNGCVSAVSRKRTSKRMQSNVVGVVMRDRSKRYLCSDSTSRIRFNPSLSASSSSLVYNNDDDDASNLIRYTTKRPKSTAVYLLMMASILSFVGDKIFRMKIFRSSFYLFHAQHRFRWWQLITSTICHADKNHLSGNLFLLLLFGRSVEDEVGCTGLIVSYLFCGILSNLVSLWLLPRYSVSIGASGAVFGLFAVSILCRINSWKDLFDWRKIIEVAVLGQYVVAQFAQETKSVVVGGVGNGNVNHIAHLSGGIAGVVLIVTLRMLLHFFERNDGGIQTE